MIHNILPRKLKDFLRNIVKKRFHFKDYNQYLVEFKDNRKFNDELIPKYDLERKHIINTQVLLNRRELLNKMPKDAICAEIGVNEGDFSKLILNITNPSKLHLIDAWGNPERYHDGLKLVVKDKFKEELKEGKVEINIGFSTEVLSKMPDEYFDWVYLDTDHSYSVTASELNILKHKIKRGGIISGHDYIIGNWIGDVRYGVIEAVHEFCVNNDWELIFITINKNEMPSFALKKI